MGGVCVGGWGEGSLINNPRGYDFEKIIFIVLKVFF